MNASCIKTFSQFRLIPTKYLFQVCVERYFVLWNGSVIVLWINECPSFGRCYYVTVCPVGEVNIGVATYSTSSVIDQRSF